MDEIGNYASGRYWAGRSDLFYYQYVQYIVKAIGKDANSILDVGSGNSPYLEWFFWINEKVSIDIRAPYESENVKAITANILTHKFPKRFDICLCLQVLEHVHKPELFARRLFDLGKIVIVSVPFKWTRPVDGQIHDPVDVEKLTKWCGRPPNMKLIADEPFVSQGRRLIAVFDADNPSRKFGPEYRLKSI